MSLLHSTISPLVFFILPVVYWLVLGTLGLFIYTLFKVNKPAKTKVVLKIYGVSLLLSITIYVFQFLLA